MYKDGDFTQTHQMARIDHASNEYFSIELEVYDKHQ